MSFLLIFPEITKLNIQKQLSFIADGVVIQQTQLVKHKEHMIKA